MSIGATGEGFGYDNEYPRHRTLLEPYRLANRLVTNGEYLAFVDDGGYRNPALWLSDGWARIHQDGWQAPLYWRRIDGAWHEMTLAGLRPLNPAEPVCHVSYFEADAFARWANRRLPTEAEWEHAAADRPVVGNFVDDGRLHPAPAGSLARNSRSNCLVTAGNGPPPPICPIPAIAPRRARWASTTASS